MADGEIPSPLKYGDFWLFDLRITGTGAAFRDAINEYAVRDPKTWLSAEFVDRCNGLPVVFGHPQRSGLNEDEWRQRSVGTVVLPYVKGDEVWGIAKIYDADAVTLMQTTHRSTSPGVLPPKGTQAITLESGAKVLDEDLPLTLDHLAICEAGVWDKDGTPEGVRLDGRKDETLMPDEEREKLEKERDDARAERDDLKSRFDAAQVDLEKAREDKRRHDEDEEEEREDKRSRKDESDREAVTQAEREKDDKRKKRHDVRKHDGAYQDCERCDSEEEEEREKEEEREDKRRKDSAPVDVIDANREQDVKDRALKDSRRINDLESVVSKLRDRLTVAEQQPSVDDRNAIAAAFHRADAIYQMFGDVTPQQLHGEKPLAYRIRLASGLRKHSERWKEHSFHDAVAGTAFDVIET
ncbi:MAG: DUF2213 domain-containing protein, partial [Vulcanimicrobiaceae bacterium]